MLILMVKKKYREETWCYTTAEGQNLKQEIISHYGNPAFVKVVEESSNKNTLISASTAKNKGKNKEKQTGNSKRNLENH